MKTQYQGAEGAAVLWNMEYKEGTEIWIQNFISYSYTVLLVQHLGSYFSPMSQFIHP